MKLKHILLGLSLLLGLSMNLSSCKAMARAAAKYWSKKQIKKFVADCETKAGKLIGEQKAAHFCDCAVDKVAEKYKNFEDAKEITALEIVKIATDCKNSQ